MTFSFYIALLTLLVVLYITIELAVGIRRLPTLKSISPDKQISQPQISVIIPALNEAETISPALYSVLNQDYGNIEVIVVNDRSTDDTGTILLRFKKQYPALRVIDIVTLPDGWLGKNHALHQGAQIASGDYLLFTDADIIMEKSTLSRAITYSLDHSLDHLALLFDAKTSNGLLYTMILEFSGGLLLHFKPWLATTDSKKYFIGVGAFNLVKKTAYQGAGGHQAIAMCPVDDIMLGKSIKSNGFKQECALGQGFVSVEWYKSVPDMIQGLKKNMFAGFDFSLLRASGAVLFLFLIGVWPVVALFCTSGLTWFINLLIITIRMTSLADACARSSYKMRYIPWILYSSLPAIYMITTSILTVLRNNGIVWRGTFYSIKELKAGKYFPPSL